MNKLLTFMAAFCLVCQLTSGKAFEVPKYAEDYSIVSHDGAWCWFSDPRAIYIDNIIYGGVVDKEGSIWAFSYDPKTQEGIQCWIDLIDEGYAPSAATVAETGSDAMFQGEQVAMTFAGSYMVPEYANNDAVAEKIDCVEIPTYNDIEDNCINGLGYAVYEGSKNKDAAIDFAIWLGSKDAQDIQGESGVVISARTESQHLFAEAKPEYNLAAYTNHADIAYPLPMGGAKTAEIYDLESTWLTKAYTGEMSLADACAGLKEEADALLAE